MHESAGEDVWIQATGGKKILEKSAQRGVSRIVVFTIYTVMINSWKMRYVGPVTCMAGEGKYTHMFTLACFIIFTFFTKFLFIM